MDYGKAFQFQCDATNGMLMLRPEGCHYDTRAAAIYYDHLKFCGCGEPNEVGKFIARLLTENSHRHEPDQPRPVSHDDALRLIKEDPDAAAWMLLYMLDVWEFTEHGGSVNGAWLTERGKQAAEVFAGETIDPDEDDT